MTMPPTRTKRERVIDTLSSAKITPDQSKKAAVGGQIGGSVGALTGTALGASIGTGLGLASRGKARRAVVAAEQAGKGVKAAKKALSAVKVGERAKTGAFLGAGSGTALGGGGGAAAGLYSGRPRKKQTVAKRRKNRFDVYFRDPANRYVDYRGKVQNADKIHFIEEYGDDATVVVGTGKVRKNWDDVLVGASYGLDPVRESAAEEMAKYDETQHRRGQGGKFAPKTGMTEAPGSRGISPQTKQKLKHAGVSGLFATGIAADAAAVKAGFHETRHTKLDTSPLRSSNRYGRVAEQLGREAKFRAGKAALPLTAVGLAAGVAGLKGEHERNKQKFAKVKPKTVASGFNKIHGAMYSGMALAGGSALVGPNKHQNRAKLGQVMRPMAKNWDDVLAKAARPPSQKMVDQQKKGARQALGTGAGIVAAGEAGGAAATRSSVKAKARSELATRVANSHPNSPWLPAPKRAKAREIAHTSAMKSAAMKDVAGMSRISGRVYGGAALALGGAAALSAHHNQKQRDSFGKGLFRNNLTDSVGVEAGGVGGLAAGVHAASRLGGGGKAKVAGAVLGSMAGAGAAHAAFKPKKPKVPAPAVPVVKNWDELIKSASSNRAPRYDKKSGRRVRNPGINPTTNQARAQRWTSEAAGVGGAAAGAIGGARAAGHGLTHAANKYQEHVTRNFYAGKPVNLSNAEKITHELHAAAKNPKVATGAALVGSAAAGTAAYNATKKTVLGVQRRGTTTKKPVSKGYDMKAVDVDELFDVAYNYDEIAKFEDETKRGAKTGATIGGGIGALGGLAIAGPRGVVSGAAGGALQGGAVGAGVGGLKARKRIKRQGLAKALSVDELFELAKAWDDDTKRTAAATGAGAAAGAGAARLGGTGVLRAAQSQLRAGVKTPTMRGAARLGVRARGAKGMALGAGIGAIAASPHRKRS